jgi:hypothetical protein
MGGQVDRWASGQVGKWTSGLQTAGWSRVTMIYYLCHKSNPMHGPPQFPFLFHLIGGLLRFLFIFGGLFFLLWYYLKQTRKPAPVVVNNQDHQTILPLRLQAYERFVLFLERIHPSNLLMRLNNPDLTAIQLQSLLVRTIREEFEYNLSQQLYISGNAWELIKNAKEETIALINHATSGLPDHALSADLVKKVFEVTISKGKLPVETTLEEIKKELQRLF